MAYTLAAEFVRVWMTSSSIAEVCQKTGMQINSAQVRASRLRRLGVKLPMWRARSPVSRRRRPQRDHRRTQRSVQVSRANTVGLVPPGAGYSEWAAKYRANADRERAIYLEALERRRAAGLLVVKEYRSGEDYEWDAVADADGDEYDRDGDEGRGLVEL